MNSNTSEPRQDRDGPRRPFVDGELVQQWMVHSYEGKHVTLEVRRSSHDKVIAVLRKQDHRGESAVAIPARSIDALLAAIADARAEIVAALGKGSTSDRRR